MEPIQSVSSLIQTGGLLAAGLVLLWVLIGFRAMDRSTSLHRRIRLIGGLLAGWLLLQGMVVAAPDDRLFWMLLGAATSLYFLATHLWQLTAFTISLKRDAPQSMRLLSLLVSAILILLLATNPFHGLLFPLVSRSELEPGPLYYLIFPGIHIAFTVGCGFIAWRLAQSAQNRRRFQSFLLALVLENLLFLLVLALDLTHRSTVMLFALPTLHTASVILLMQFMQRPAGGHFLRFRLAAWDPATLAMSGSAVLIFNRQERLVSVHGNLPGVPEAPGSFRDLLDVLKQQGMSGKDLAELERRWLEGGKTATGRVASDATDIHHDWTLHTFTRLRSLNRRRAPLVITRVLVFSDATERVRTERESTQMAWQLSQLRHAIESHGHVDRDWAAARETNLTLRMLQGTTKDSFRDLKHRMGALTEMETDPTIRSWQLHDAELLTRKMLLQIRKGLSDLLLADPRH